MAETTERTEYRVVGERADGSPSEVIADDCERGLAETYARSYGRDAAFTNVRTQLRTVTETPWVDLDEQEGK